MRPRQYFCLLTFGLTLVYSCSKKQTATPVPTSPTINGVTYPAVKIGNQWWTTVNYNGPGGVNFGNSQTNSAAYGKLYTFAEAQAVKLPAGWRVPKFPDWNNLITALGGTGLNNPAKSNLSKSAIQSLMASADWRDGSGSNTTGFNAYPGGAFSDINNYGVVDYVDYGYTADFMGSTQYLNGQTVNFYIRQDSVNHVMTAGLGEFLLQQRSRASIRFVKDN